MDNINTLNLSILSDGTGDDRYVIFNLAEGKFAVHCRYVVSIEPPVKITEMANASLGVRGVGYYKDEAINIFDLRVIFGYQSHEFHVENEININGHIAEHENWAAGIREKIGGGALSPDFTSDPLSCGLGNWLENYKTSNMNVQNLVKRIRPIHENFHAFAVKAEDFRSDNQEQADKFLAEAEAAKDELTRNLSELHNVLLGQSKELTVVLKVDGKKIGIIIDDAESVETMDDIQQLPPAALATEYIKNLGFRNKDKQIVLILEAEMFV